MSIMAFLRNLWIINRGVIREWRQIKWSPLCVKFSFSRLSISANSLVADDAHISPTTTRNVPWNDVATLGTTRFCRYCETVPPPIQRRAIVMQGRHAEKWGSHWAGPLCAAPAAGKSETTVRSRSLLFPNHLSRASTSLIKILGPVLKEGRTAFGDLDILRRKGGAAKENRLWLGHRIWRFRGRFIWIYFTKWRKDNEWFISVVNHSFCENSWT